MGILSLFLCRNDTSPQAGTQKLICFSSLHWLQKQRAWANLFFCLLGRLEPKVCDARVDSDRELQPLFCVCVFVCVCVSPFHPSIHAPIFILRDNMLSLLSSPFSLLSSLSSHSLLSSLSHSNSNDSIRDQLCVSLSHTYSHTLNWLCSLTHTLSLSLSFNPPPLSLPTAHTAVEVMVRMFESPTN